MKGERSEQRHAGAGNGGNRSSFIEYDETQRSSHHAFKLGGDETGSKYPHLFSAVLTKLIKKTQLYRWNKS